MLSFVKPKLQAYSIVDLLSTILKFAREMKFMLNGVIKGKTTC
jgi:hypothetical protein